MRKQTVAVLAGVVLALIGAAAAGGYGVARTVDVQPRATAEFVGNNWSCRNLRSHVVCRHGDAYPYAELSVVRRGGIAVRVFTLRDPQGGKVTRDYVRRNPVWTFTAF